MDEAALRQNYRQIRHVPDWSASEGYRYVEVLSPDLLRWEFLRRLPEYRAAWDQRAYHLSFDFCIKDFVNPALDASDPALEVKFIEPDLSGKLFDVARFEDLEAFRPSPKFIELARESGHYDWYGNDAEIDAAILAASTPSHAELIGEAVLEMIDRGYVFFTCDTRRPPTPQSAMIADTLGQLSKNCSNRKPRADFNPITSLRCMDAYSEHVAVHGTDAELNRSQVACVIFLEKTQKYKVERYAIHRDFDKALAAGRDYPYRANRWV